MKLTASEVLRRALQLPPRARADIAGTLLRSLDEIEDPGVEAAWRAEVARRLEEIDSGRVRLVPWDTVERAMRAKIRRAQSPL